jgi:hypothetical protein
VVEAAFAAAGLQLAAAYEIGTEWREWEEERSQPAVLDQWLGIGGR